MSWPQTNIVPHQKFARNFAAFRICSNSACCPGVRSNTRFADCFTTCSTNKRLNAFSRGKSVVYPLVSTDIASYASIYACFRQEAIGTNSMNGKDALHSDSQNLIPFFSTEELNQLSSKLARKNNRTRAKTMSLARLFPDVAAQLHQTLNGTITAAMILGSYCGSFIWQCSVNAKEHVWKGSVSDRTSGSRPVARFAKIEK